MEVATHLHVPKHHYSDIDNYSMLNHNKLNILGNTHNALILFYPGKTKVVVDGLVSK